MKIDLKKIIISLIIIIPGLFFIQNLVKTGEKRIKKSFTKKNLQKILEKYVA